MSCFNHWSSKSFWVWWWKLQLKVNCPWSCAPIQEQTFDSIRLSQEASENHVSIWYKYWFRFDLNAHSRDISNSNISLDRPNTEEYCEYLKKKSLKEMFAISWQWLTLSGRSAFSLLSSLALSNIMQNSQVYYCEPFKHIMPGAENVMNFFYFIYRLNGFMKNKYISVIRCWWILFFFLS